MKIDRTPLLRPISIQNIFLDQEEPERVLSGPSCGVGVGASLPLCAGTFQRVLLAPCSIPTCPSASSRVLGKALHTQKRSKQSKKRQHIQQNIYDDERFGKILVLSTKFANPPPASYSRIIASKYVAISPELTPLQTTSEYTQEHPSLLRDVSETLISPIPSSTSTAPEPPWSGCTLRSFVNHSKVVLNIAKLPEARSLPTPILPRKPQRQTEIESLAESGKTEVVTPKPDTLIRSQRLDPEAHVLRGEGFKTIAATRYDTIMAMTSLAIINCQIYARNTLNLKAQM